MSGKNLTKSEFAHLIPHTGNMAFIDSVRFWDQNEIQCISHNSPYNQHPLQIDGIVSSLTLLEYGAQAIAIHAGLLSNTCRPGFLAAIRDAHFFVDFLHPNEEYLKIHAVAELKLDNGAIYQFTVRDPQGKILVTARATVINAA